METNMTFPVYFKLLVILIISFLSISRAFKFGFGETDYRRREGKGPLTVHLSRLGASENLTVTVRPVSYTWQNASEDIKEKMQMFSSKPSVAATPGLDFSADPIIVSIPEGQDEDFEVMVDIVDDTVNEAEEGFFLVIEQEGLPPATKLERCITLVIVPDNDLLTIGFENSLYYGTEGSSGIVKIAKGQGQVTEQDFTVKVAKTVIGEPQYVLPSPEVFFPATLDSIDVPFEVLDDSVVERDMSFQLLIVEDSSIFQIDRAATTIQITDNDVISIGFGSVKLSRDQLTVTVINVNETELSTVTVVSTVVTLVGISGESTTQSAFLVPKVNDVVISFNKNEIQGFGSTVTGRLNKTQDFVVIDKDRDTFQFNLAPSSPVIESVMIVNEKDLNITWMPPANHPVDQYEVLITIMSEQGRRRKKQQEAEEKKFFTSNSFFVYEDVDLTKAHQIRVLAENTYGKSPYSAPYEFDAILVPTSTPGTLNPAPVGTDPTRKKSPFPWWWIVIALIIGLLFCCFLAFLFVCLCCLRTERKAHYYPSKNEKNHRSQYEQYRGGRSPSITSDDFI